MELMAETKRQRLIDALEDKFKPEMAKINEFLTTEKGHDMEAVMTAATDFLEKLFVPHGITFDYSKETVLECCNFVAKHGIMTRNPHRFIATMKLSGVDIPLTYVQVSELYLCQNAINLAAYLHELVLMTGDMIEKYSTPFKVNDKEYRGSLQFCDIQVMFEQLPKAADTPLNHHFVKEYMQRIGFKID